MRFWIFPLFAITLAAQTPLFEVASIRPGNKTNTGSLCYNLKPSPESVLASAVWPLSAVIEDAYTNEVDDFDFPQWSGTGNFAISVKIPPNTSVVTCRKMLQNFLTERFHMVTAVETREVQRYYLKVAKSGLKLKPVENPSADLNDSAKFEVKDGVTRHTYRGAPMSKILNSLLLTAYREASGLSFRLASVDSIVDETGLTGYYDGEFRFTALLFSRRDDFPSESLADALTRQLGLTLELRKAPGKVLVIRSSDRMPTEN